MKAYFTNLDECTDRRAYMEETLGRLGVAHERVGAIDARIMSEAEIAEHYRVPDGGSAIDRGAIGCFLTHRWIWQRVAESDDPHVLVFEDDVLFGEHAGEILTDFSWLPDNADLVRFETFTRHTVYDTRPVAQTHGRKLVRLRYQHLGSAAYLLSRRAAKHLVETTETFGFAPDAVLFNPDCPEFCGLEILQMVPALCIQSMLAPAEAQDRHFPSVIQQSRKKARSRGLKRLGEKVARELEKDRLILSGLMFDRLRGRTTGRISFR